MAKGRRSIADKVKASKKAGKGSKPKSSNKTRTAAPKAIRKTVGVQKNARKTPAPKGLLVGVGLASVDMLCVAPRLGDRVAEVSLFSMQGGGTIGNLVATAAALGASARYFGRLGDDDFGRYILRGLEEYDVDCTLVKKQAGGVSPLAIVQIDELTRKRRVLTTRGSLTPLSPQELPRTLLQNATILCIDGYNPSVQAIVAEKARDKGMQVLLNASHLVGGMGDLLGLADIVIGSERFANEFAPSDRIDQSLSEIVRLGPKTAVITMGNDGAIGLEGDKLVQQGALDVFVADSTGAGDIFSGAFAFATMMGWPLEKALPFANTTAGLCCRNIGARAGIPTLQEVLEAMEPA